LSSSTPIAVIDVIVVINGFKNDSRHHIYAISIALIAIAFTVIAVISPFSIYHCHRCYCPRGRFHNLPIVAIITVS
jgi:hypothetical protein